MAQEDFNTANTVVVYGTPGNQFGDTMVGGTDVEAINNMLQSSFDEGIAGVGEALVKIGEFKTRSVFEQKAADQIRISIDDEGNAFVKLIIRELDPGLGLLALAGGFKDDGETDQQAADREEAEEAKSDAGVFIDKYEIQRHPVKGDVRVWGGPDRDDGVKNSDIIAMSTVAMVPVVRNAHSYAEAGDDATNAGWVKLSDLSDANVFGIKGHARMLLQAVELADLSNQLPENFAKSLETRQEDITVATQGLRRQALSLLEVVSQSNVVPTVGTTSGPA